MLYSRPASHSQWPWLSDTIQGSYVPECTVNWSICPFLGSVRMHFGRCYRLVVSRPALYVDRPRTPRRAHGGDGDDTRGLVSHQHRLIRTPFPTNPRQTIHRTVLACGRYNRFLIFFCQGPRCPPRPRPTPHADGCADPHEGAECPYVQNLFAPRRCPARRP